ncbi:MAG TPA: hypothetical protein VKH18_14160 [Terriglobales bacterium]|nr:hypothetical protein [Terriglobales bacterium]
MQKLRQARSLTDTYFFFAALKDKPLADFLRSDVAVIAFASPRVPFTGCAVAFASAGRLPINDFFWIDMVVIPFLALAADTPEFLLPLGSAPRAITKSTACAKLAARSATRQKCWLFIVLRLWFERITRGWESTRRQRD